MPVENLAIDGGGPIAVAAFLKQARQVEKRRRVVWPTFRPVAKKLRRGVAVFLGENAPQPGEGLEMTGVDLDDRGEKRFCLGGAFLPHPQPRHLQKRLDV